jgi:hypothetical protein
MKKDSLPTLNRAYVKEMGNSFKVLGITPIALEEGVPVSTTASDEPDPTKNPEIEKVEPVQPLPTWEREGSFSHFRVDVRIRRHSLGP